MQVAEVANRQRWWALFRPSVGDECSLFIETCAEILREHGVVLQDLIAINVKRMSILNFLSHIDGSDFHWKQRRDRQYGGCSSLPAWRFQRSQDEVSFPALRLLVLETASKLSHSTLATASASNSKLSMDCCCQNVMLSCFSAHIDREPMYELQCHTAADRGLIVKQTSDTAKLR
jgi:hypothetical protein